MVFLIQVRGLKIDITGKNKNNQDGTPELLMQVFTRKGNKIFDVLDGPDALQTPCSGVTWIPASAFSSEKCIKDIISSGFHNQSLNQSKFPETKDTTLANKPGVIQKYETLFNHV